MVWCGGLVGVGMDVDVGCTASRQATCAPLRANSASWVKTSLRYVEAKTKYVTKIFIKVFNYRS